jgi:molybdopterin molybdotransferase
MSLLRVEEAIARALSGLTPVGIETVALAHARGRVLACDLAARRDQPPQANSAMDGYAVRHEDVAAVPARLRVIGSAPAGHPFAGEVGPGETVRIFTGGVLPRGADTIVIQENTAADGDHVEVREPAAQGRYVRARGLDFHAGDVLLPAGLVLRPRDIALAAAMNHAELPVRRRPRVAILSTGDEVVAPGDPLAGELIVSSNSYGLMALVEAVGGLAANLGIAPDDAGRIGQTIGACDDSDIIVTLGGASVGEHDLVRAGLEGALELDFWRIAMRPGKPLMHGRIGRARFLGLPGNPVSAMVCGQLFLKPMIRRLLGLAGDDGPLGTEPLGAPLPANDERQDYLRARREIAAGGPVVVAFERQDSSMLRRLQQADCFIVRAPHAPAAKAGDRVPVLPIDL